MTAAASASVDADPSDNAATAETTATNPPPAISCPADVAVSNDAGQCGATVAFAEPSASDNCSVASVVCEPPSGAYFATGTTTVTCTATDSGGATASCAFAVTVADAEAPAIACPANVTAAGTATDGGTISTIVTYGAPAASDNCGVASVTCVPASGSVFEEGTTTVTCTAVDTSGITASCAFTVTVATGFGVCCFDDATGDTWSIVTDPASPLFRFWRYRVAATGELFCGTASSMAYIPRRSLTASDDDDPRFFMEANLNYGANSGTVKVIDRATNRQFVIKDRNLRNNPACQ